MKLDKRTIDSLLQLPDDKLVMMIRTISGGEFPKKDPDRKTVAGLRTMLSQITDSDIERALQLISLYKMGKKL